MVTDIKFKKAQYMPVGQWVDELSRRCANTDSVVSRAIELMDNPLLLTAPPIRDQLSLFGNRIIHTGNVR